MLDDERLLVAEGWLKLMMYCTCAGGLCGVFWRELVRYLATLF